MTSEEALQFIQIAKLNGVSSLKFENLEVQFNVPPFIAPIPQEIAAEDQKIKHRVDELKSVMQLGDEELISRMFPLSQEEDESA